MGPYLQDEYKSQSCGDLCKQVFTPSSLQNLQGALALVWFVLHSVLKYQPPIRCRGYYLQYFSLKIRGRLIRDII